MQTQSSVRPHKSNAEKVRILEACKHSGLTREAFATQHGIGVSTLYEWRRQNRRGASTGRSDLIEVPNLFGRGAAAAPYRLHLAGGQVLELARGFDLAEVRALTQLLQGL
jgi:transposase-like protein